MERKRLLIVEDDANSRFALKAVMEHRGYKVLAVKSAEAVWSEIDHEAFDAAVIDIRTPTSGAGALANELMRRHAGVTVIFVTAHPDVQSPIPECTLLTKPIQVEELCRSLETARRNN